MFLQHLVTMIKEGLKMKKYNTPEINIVVINNEDIITSSGLNAKTLQSGQNGLKSGVQAEALGLNS